MPVVLQNVVSTANVLSGFSQVTDCYAAVECRNCTFAANGRHGAFIGVASGITNCIATSNASFGFAGNTFGQRPPVRYSDAWNNGIRDYDNVVPEFCLSADPQYIDSDTGHYQLRACFKILDSPGARRTASRKAGMLWRKEKLLMVSRSRSCCRWGCWDESGGLRVADGSDRRAVEVDRAVFAQAQVQAPSARSAVARDRQRDSVFAAHGMRVAASAARFSEVAEGIHIFPALAQGRGMGKDP